jgi:hypothetical protein
MNKLAYETGVPQPASEDNVIGHLYPTAVVVCGNGDLFG